jgi:serine protease Do
MKRLSNVILIVLVAFVGGMTAIFAYNKIFDKPQYVTVKESQPIQLTTLASAPVQMPDLTIAAENSVKGVVHIKTQFTQPSFGGGSGNPLYDFFFGDRGGYYPQQPQQIQQATGSGVIISNDGFIVTNNHVIEKSQAIKVVLNDNREYDAKLIGTDASTDLALLKIDAQDLHVIEWGNSDELKLGEWVLAVGNPFNLTSTVTAGIVSAKARGIGISGNNMSIESFIQTDAAVNPGNSGGALVNTRGELVGINTAIASRTGSFTGYSFAIPVSIVRKVVEDLKQYGEVQRALLGVEIQTVNAELAKENKLDKVEGVYIAGISEGGAAEDVGMKVGDVIVGINKVHVNTSNELQEQVSRYRPGDKISVSVKRDNKEKLFEVTLRNTRGNTEVIQDRMNVLGAELATIGEKEKEKLNVHNGLIINKLSNGKLKSAGIKEGFVITSVNKRAVNTVDEMKEMLNRSRGGVLIEGVYPNGQEAYYVFGLN